MEITFRELEQTKEEAMNEADKIIAEKIIKYAKQGYTAAGIVWLVCNFNLATGKGRDEKIENPFKGEAIQIIEYGSRQLKEGGN